MNICRSLVELSHDILSEVLKEGDSAVDCTAGNGNDTIFLADKVGSKGSVYSFDIQNAAIENTSKRLKDSGFDQRVQLINDSHENLDQYVFNPIKAAIYNLGYLPGGNHNIITKPESTIKSLEKLIGLLEVNGIIIVVIYYGHPGGMQEKEIVLNYVSKLEKSKFIVQKVELLNMNNNPPILVIIKKVKNC